ncbi:MAG TPA: ABC transporter permease [Thermoanaerobaculia bacterium]
MSVLSDALARGRELVFRRRRARELDEELQFHVERDAEARVRRGVDPDEARRQAVRALGGIDQAKENVWDAQGVRQALDLGGDLRFALRVLRRSPGFTAVAVLTLALGIGASTAIFSVVDAVLLRPLPYPNPGRVVRVWEQAPNGHRMNLAAPNFQDFLAQNDTFASLAAYSNGLSSVSVGGEPARLDVAFVSGAFFKTLGVEPSRGRVFVPDEQRPHGAPAVIVSHGYWQRSLGAAADLSGLRLTIEGLVYPVVGVMPTTFDFPPGVAAWISSDRDPDTAGRTAHNWRSIGRLRDGVTLAGARANLGAIARRIRSQFGKDVDLDDVAVAPLAEALVGDVRTALLTLLGAVGLLLLVACANVAGLLLARTASRRKELAVRAALGASRGRLVRQFLVESLALSLAGGALGIVLAAGAIRVLPAILPTNLPRQEGIAINAPVLLFALAAAVAVAVSLGLFAAWRAAAEDVREGLAAGSRRYIGSGGSQRLRGLLVTGEIALTLVILIGAGLLGRSFLRLVSTSPGLAHQDLITMEFSPPIPPWGDTADHATVARQIHLMDDLLARLGAIPGVEAVGLTGALPVAAGDDLADGTFLILDGQKAPADFDEFGRMARNPSQVGHALYCVAGEAYFRTAGIPLRRGRLFGDQDALDSPHVVVISESLARERWPNQDPIGREIDFGNMDGNLKPQTIVGIVGDVRARGLDLPPSPVIYFDYRQRGMHANSSPTILLRSARPAGEIVAAARGVFRRLAPEVPVKFSTFAQELGGWLADRRFLLLLVGLFAASALGLAAVGIYAVVAFSVTRRTQEIGIRMALGARRGDVLRLVMGEGARMAAAGVAVGVAASLAVTRVLSALLYGTSATDPVTFAAVAALLALVALVASYIPARRAMGLAPDIALRRE